MKRGFRFVGILLLVAVLSVMLIGCNFRRVNEKPVDAAPKVNFDLSEYYSYGHLSCGRIWVTKIMGGDWNKTPKLYFGYLDVDGNLIYGWDEIGQVSSSGEPWYYVSFDPQDYKNDYVCVRYDDDLTYVDINGNCIPRKGSIFLTMYLQEDRSREAKYTEIDEDGYAYFIGTYWPDNNTEGEEGFYVIGPGGTITYLNGYIPLPAGFDDIQRVEGGGYFFPLGMNSVFFDKDGKAVIYFYNQAGIQPSEMKLLGNEQIWVKFRGSDNKTYQAVVNYYGIFVENPTPIQ